MQIFAARSASQVSRNDSAYVQCVADTAGNLASKEVSAAQWLCTHPIIVACQWKRSSGEVGPARHSAPRRSAVASAPHRHNCCSMSASAERTCLQIVLSVFARSGATQAKHEHEQPRSSPLKCCHWQLNPEAHQRCRRWAGPSEDPSAPAAAQRTRSALCSVRSEKERRTYLWQHSVPMCDGARSPQGPPHNMQNSPQQQHRHTNSGSSNRLNISHGWRLLQARCSSKSCTYADRCAAAPC